MADSGEPGRTLAPSARLAWAVQQAAIWGVALIIGGIVSGPVDGALAPLLWVVPLLGLVVAPLVVPRLRWRRWRWDVRPQAIDIRHGTLTIRRTLIPLERVQHVDTRRGVLEQMLGLSTVIVHTAAGSHTIPLLSEWDADALGGRIASLADVDAG